MANTKVQSEQIEDGSITADKIADGAIVATELADNAVTTAKINADAVTGAKIADDAINSEHYTDGSIDTAHIADDQITQAKMANDSVGADELAANAVVTASIVDANVTTAKIADGNISTAKIADNAVTSAKIDTNIAIAGDLTVQGGQINTGNTSGDHSEFGTDGSGHTFIDASTSGGDLFLQAGGSTKVTMKSDGKVGIGTTSPTSNLHVSSSSGNSASFMQTTNSGSSASSNYQTPNRIFYTGIDIGGVNSAYTIYDGTASVERFKIDSADIVLTTTGNANATLSVKNMSASSQSGIQLSGYDDNHAMTFRRGYDGSLNVIDFYEYGNSGGDAYRWFTNGVQANQTQKLNLQTDGELIQGTAIADTYSPLVVGITGDALVVGRHSTSGSLGLWRTNTMEFKYYHNGQGYIMTFGSNGVISGDFNDTSDLNLKENISSISDGTTVIKALRPVKFDWKASAKGNNQHGFIAQEVETVLPDAVEGNDYVENKTGLPEDEPEQNGKTINSNAVLAHAVKAIQELEARIEALES